MVNNDAYADGYDRIFGKEHKAQTYTTRKRETRDSHHVIGDIEPYQSMIDGSWITSRSQHRKHLREHGCIEVGNERMDPKRKEPDTSGIRESIRESRAILQDQKRYNRN
jgi:hypothetical protein